jgi:undecaprenyl-diphosphatase
MPDGSELFVKIVSRDQRNADWLFKAWRFVSFRELEDEAPFATPKQQIEHEAYLGLLAERARVRVPALVIAAQVDEGTALLAEQMVEGRGLNSLAQQEIDDELLNRLWGQVGLLRAARIAHRDLRRNNVVVDTQRNPWIIDFGYAEAAASSCRMGQDIAELLASLSCVVGAKRAVATAVAALDQEAVLSAMTFLQPLALSSVSQAQVRTQPKLLQEIRQQVAELTGVESPPAPPLTRVQMRTALALAGAAFAIHLLLPQVGELGRTIAAFQSVRWEWLIPAALGATLTYISAALALTATVEQPLAFLRTALVQLAGSFINRLTPAGIGGADLIERYLERAGVERPTAIAALATSMAATSLIHIPALIVTATLLGMSGVEPVHLPKYWHLLAASALGLAILGGIVLLRWPAGRRKLAPLAAAARGLLNLAKTPSRVIRLFTGAAGMIATDVFTLTVCLRAFGVSASLLKVLAVYLGGTAIASASPTPGGLGAVEAALVAGFTAVGLPAGPAVAGVLTFRLFTFWLPILPGFVAFRYLQRRQVV